MSQRRQESTIDIQCQQLTTLGCSTVWAVWMGFTGFRTLFTAGYSNTGTIGQQQVREPEI